MPGPAFGPTASLLEAGSAGTHWYTRSSMANIKSQIKRNKQNERAHQRNKAVRTSLKTASKKVVVAVSEGEGETAQARAREAGRAFDKAAAKGIVHKRTAARHKSRLDKAANRAASASTE